MLTPLRSAEGPKNSHLGAKFGLGRQLHQQATQVGWQSAEIQIALSDGGSGLENFLHTYFPRVICILDFWHAAEHLSELARVMHSDDEFETTFQRWCHVMKHEGGRTLLSELVSVRKLTFYVESGCVR